MSEHLFTKNWSEWYIGNPSDSHRSENGYQLHWNMPFSDYAQVYENTVNDTTERTVGAICLRPTYNIQGVYTFIS